MRLYLINPSNPLVSIVKVRESRWNRYRVWRPLSLMVLAGLTSPDWEITIVDENLGAPDYPAMPPPDPHLDLAGCLDPYVWDEHAGPIGPDHRNPPGLLGCGPKPLCCFL
jgi:hypothetical protein